MRKLLSPTYISRFIAAMLLLCVGTIIGCEEKPVTPRIVLQPNNATSGDTDEAAPEGADEGDPFAAGEADPSMADARDGESSEDNATPDGTGDATAANNAKPVQLVERTRPDSVPAPAKPFSGESLPADSPIPDDARKKLDSSDDEKIPALVELALTHPHPEVRRRAVDGLAYLEKAETPKFLSALRGALNDPSPIVRAEAADTVPYLKEHGIDAVWELIPLINDSDEKVREETLETLKGFGPAAEPAVPRLAAALRDKNYKEKNDVLRVLAEIGPAAKGALPEIKAHFISDKEGYDYLHAAPEAMGKIGAEVEILAAWSSRDYLLKSNAFNAATHLSKPGAKVVDRLIRLATSTDGIGIAYERSRAVDKLAEIRPTSREIFVALTKCAQSENKTVREGGLKALGKIEPTFPEAKPILETAAKDPDEAIRKVAVASLAKYLDSPESKYHLLLDQAVEQEELGWDVKQEWQKNAKECERSLGIVLQISGG
ncbi:MAG: HEAT repeat domain-containing protein [Planctomycetota bacterium]|nr:HEAT repeat domain-containing protein [Planctomycetota bacterium]